MSNETTKSNKYHNIKINLKKNININSRNIILHDTYQSNFLKNKNFFKNPSNAKKSLFMPMKSNNSFNSTHKSDSNDEEEKYVNSRKNLFNSKRTKTTKKIFEFSKNRLFDLDYNPNNFYEMINNYTKKQKLKINAKETNSSYLSLDIDLMNLLNNNLSLNKLELWTKNDEKFIRECKTSNNDILFKYCDLINYKIEFKNEGYY